MQQEQIDTSSKDKNAPEEPPVLPVGDQFIGTGHAFKNNFDDLFK
jgi:hypothetical protein